MNATCNEEAHGQLQLIRRVLEVEGFALSDLLLKDLRRIRERLESYVSGAVSEADTTDLFQDFPELMRRNPVVSTALSEHIVQEAIDFVSTAVAQHTNDSKPLNLEEGKALLDLLKSAKALLGDAEG